MTQNPANMEKIKITRVNEWNNWTRDYRIYIDGQEIGTISDGETKEFYVPTGQHKLKARLFWGYGSEDFPCTIANNDKLSVTISSFQRIRYVMGGFSLILLLHYILFWAFDIKYLILLEIPLLPFVIYYSVVARRKYLLIKES